MTSGDFGAESSSNDEGSADLLRRIRAGDAFAIQEFSSRFSAGIAFLLRRKVGNAEASGEVAAVIEAAVKAIQSSRAGEVVNLPRLIVRIIHLQFSLSAGDVSSARHDSVANSIAKSVIEEMSQVEQNVLRRYYVRGDSLETIQRRLRISSQAIKETVSKARSRFLHRAGSA